MWELIGVIAGMVILGGAIGFFGKKDGNSNSSGKDNYTDDSYSGNNDRSYNDYKSEKFTYSDGSQSGSYSDGSQPGSYSDGSQPGSYSDGSQSGSYSDGSPYQD